MKVTIIKSLIDETYLHVHHAKICEILEQSRVDFFMRRGMDINKLIHSGIFPVLSALNLKFLREIKEGDHEVTCEEFSVTSDTFVVKQSILNQKGKICANAHAEIKFLYKSTGRSGRVPLMNEN